MGPKPVVVVGDDYRVARACGMPFDGAGIRAPLVTRQKRLEAMAAEDLRAFRRAVLEKHGPAGQESLLLRSAVNESARAHPDNGRQRAVGAARLKAGGGAQGRDDAVAASRPRRRPWPADESHDDRARAAGADPGLSVKGSGRSCSPASGAVRATQLRARVLKRDDYRCQSMRTPRPDGGRSHRAPAPRWIRCDPSNLHDAVRRKVRVSRPEDTGGIGRKGALGR